jgi:hypothetical protein
MTLLGSINYYLHPCGLINRKVSFEKSYKKTGRVPNTGIEVSLTKISCGLRIASS